MKTYIYIHASTCNKKSGPPKSVRLSIYRNESLLDNFDPKKIILEILIKPGVVTLYGVNTKNRAFSARK